MKQLKACFFSHLIDNKELYESYLHFSKTILKSDVENAREEALNFLIANPGDRLLTSRKKFVNKLNLINGPWYQALLRGVENKIAELKTNKSSMCKEDFEKTVAFLMLQISKLELSEEKTRPIHEELLELLSTESD